MIRTILLSRFDWLISDRYVVHFDWLLVNRLIGPSIGPATATNGYVSRSNEDSFVEFLRPVAERSSAQEATSAGSINPSMSRLESRLVGPFYFVHESDHDFDADPCFSHTSITGHPLNMSTVNLSAWFWSAY
jgi:hypothetical protein